MGSYSMSLLHILLLQLAALGTVYCERCGNSDGWEKIEGQWFLFRDDHQVYGDKSWSQAEKYCRVRGANLASVTSEEMFEGLKKRMKLGELWIGLQDPHRNGSWIWSDGSPFELEKWFEGEPSDLG